MALKLSAFLTFVALATCVSAQTMIYDCIDLQNMKNNLAGNYALANNINCSDTVNWSSFGGTGFRPIAIDGGEFSGTLDGQGYEIYDLVIDRPTVRIGLFRQTSATAQIYSLGLLGGSIKGTTDVGSLVGRNFGTITECYSTADVIGGDETIGGLVGQNWGAISKSYTTGSVTGPYLRTGGFVGQHLGTINQCYSTGRVLGHSSRKGLVGQQSNSGTVVINSYWDIETSGLSTSDGGVGKTTAEMFQKATFIGWDFITVWWLHEGHDYPKLRAVIPPPVQVIQPITDKINAIGQLFSFTVPEDTMEDSNDPSLNYTAQLQGGSPLPSWLTFTEFTRVFQGIPLTGAQGSYNIEVIGTNDDEYSESDFFVLTVTNRDPVQDNALLDQSTDVGVPLSYVFASNTFSDGDNDPLTYTAQLSGGGALPSWLSLNSGTRTFSGTPASGDQGSFTVNLIASDAFGGSVVGSFSLAVNNQAPILQNPLGNVSAFYNVPFGLTVPIDTFVDSDSDALSYSAVLFGDVALPSWLTFSSSTRVFSGTQTESDEGKYKIQVSVDDEHGGLSSTTFFITVAAIGSGNNPPVVVVAIQDQTGNAGELWTFTVPSNTFSDPDSDPLTYTATLEGGGALSSWLTFDDQSQIFSGIPSAVEVIRLTVRAEDGQGGFTLDTFTLTIQDPTNQPPVLLNQLPNQNVKVESSFRYTIPDNTFSDPNGDELLYTATQSGNKPLPGWLKFDTTSRTFSGKPSNTDTGTYEDRTHTIQVCVSDGEGSACSSFLLAVVGASEAQEAITALIVLASIGSTAFGVYRNRAWFWNHLAKKKYQKPDQVVAVNHEFSYQFGVPVDQISRVQAFKNGNPLPNDERLPYWLGNDKTDITSLRGTPPAPETLTVCAFAYDGRILESFKLCCGSSNGNPAKTTEMQMIEV